MLLRVRFSHRCELLAAHPRLFETETNDPFDTRTREDCGLHCDFIGRAGMDTPTSAGIFAFRVLADAKDVETFRAEGTLNARQEPVRPYVGVLRKPFPDRQQQSME